MARFLAALVARFRLSGDWVHVRELIHTNTFASTNGTFLEHWGFIRPAPENEEGGTSGRWKPTVAGVEFVEGKRSAPAAVYLHNNTVVGWAEETTTFREASTEAFRREEVLA